MQYTGWLAVKNSTHDAQKLETLIAILRKRYDVEQPESLEPIERLIHSFLTWEASATQATAALQCIKNNVVDFNELRVCMPDEILSIIGDNYPLGQERAIRLRTTLNDIFQKDHDLSLVHLREKNRNDVRDYLGSLEGMVSYVASRIMLLALGVSAIPVDEQLHTALIKTGVAHDNTNVISLASWLERQIRSGDRREIHLLFQYWVEDGAPTDSTDQNFHQTDDYADAKQSPA